MLKISLKLIRDSIEFFLKQKRELLAGREDESDDEEVKENTSEVGVGKDPKRKGKGRVVIFSLAYEVVTQCFED